jgi:hypothetical protein
MAKAFLLEHPKLFMGAPGFSRRDNLPREASHEDRG